MTDRDRWFVLQAGEVEDLAVGFSERLKAGETLTGTPKITVHDRTTPFAQYAGVTISGAQRNSAPLEEKDANGTVIATHGIDEAVEFRITADDDATPGKYTLRPECSTTAGRSLVEPVVIDLRGPPET